MSDTITVRPGKWELRVEVWRSVACGSCDYMAREWLSPPAAKANGCCTKCGHIWSRDLSREEQREALRTRQQHVPPTSREVEK